MEKEGRTRGKGGEGGEVTPYFLQTDRLLCLTEIVAFQKTIQANRAMTFDPRPSTTLIFIRDSELV